MISIVARTGPESDEDASGRSPGGTEARPVALSHGRQGPIVRAHRLLDGNPAVSRKGPTAVMSSRQLLQRYDS